VELFGFLDRGGRAELGRVGFVRYDPLYEHEPVSKRVFVLLEQPLGIVVGVFTSREKADHAFDAFREIAGDDAEYATLRRDVHEAWIDDEPPASLWGPAPRRRHA
jgi:hypothetical protein